jgi:hypothetical protein
MHSHIALRGLTHFAPQLVAFWQQASARTVLTELDQSIEQARNASVIDAGG